MSEISQQETYKKRRINDQYRDLRNSTIKNLIPIERTSEQI